MTNFYLVRHAEAEGNLYHIAQGQYDSDLTSRGYQQLEALKERFSHVHLDAVYASGLYRACATAAALSLPKHLPCLIEPNLLEINVGPWENRTWGDISRTDHALLRDFTTHMDTWQLPGAETPSRVQARIKEGIFHIAAKHPGQTVAAVSHSYAIRLLLSWAAGLPLSRAGEFPQGSNTAVSLLEVEENKVHLVFWNDDSHLQSPSYLASVLPRRGYKDAGLWFREPNEHDTELPFHFGDHLRASWTLLGFREDQLAAILGMDGKTIRFLRVLEPFRHSGYGIQLIGQALQYARDHGFDELAAVPPESDAGRAFLLASDFLPGAEPDGLWRRDIRRLPPPEPEGD